MSNSRSFFQPTGWRDSLTRRDLLRRGAVGLGIVATGPGLLGCRPARSGPLTPVDLSRLQELSEPDAHGLRLGKGFRSRIVARSGEAPAAGAAQWHGAPDGGACFAAEDGGWIYVSNSEIGDAGGGASALRFDERGRVIDSYPILEGTTLNCAGGATPWGSWLSCEETEGGLVWECDPTGKTAAVARPALGRFIHEAAAYAEDSRILYLTEDHPEGKLYRFVPESFRADGTPDLTSGRLEALQTLDNDLVAWLPVPDPEATAEKTRYQVPDATSFYGGEGIWWRDGVVYFSTKYDNKVWALDVAAGRLRVFYDINNESARLLNGVDNIVGYGDDRLVVAEDNEDEVKELVVLGPAGEVVPLAQLTGHADSELTGPAFAPDGKRLYFSSQRGISGENAGGMTFEIEGPFFKH